MSNHQPKGHGKFREIQLNNKFGIKDQFVINEAEALLTTLAAAEGMPSGEFDIDHLKAIHKHLLGDMYDWAGTLRTTELAVGNDARLASSSPSHVEADTRRVLQQISRENFKDMNRVQFADKMAMYYTHLYVISPFPDGNARTTRAFLETLATANDMQFEWGKVPGDAFNSAVEMAVNGDHKGLKLVMRTIAQPIDLFDLHSTDAIKNRSASIINKVGLDDTLLPKAEMATVEDVSKLARFAKLEVVRSLEQYAANGSSFIRDWAKTSIEHSQKTTYDRSQGSAILKDAIRRLEEKATQPSLRGPG